eukprot:gnl/TRDRNA2_/TRDRNA2_136562_c3_seq1.p1 gnl/TRDRNA2_/TRDRNA2_136562_c3~~gnl/TRDRNA2_/TRDRNA2_136562_c3_seq1.p1  ORF type:complete len:459 (-),score=93.47 gnl/TRDRNA2_/TRDRNA2_136562_c3_seq1:37-1413(-)
MFTVPAKQRSRGQISVWQPPDSVLALRRGSVQDHAVALCCALLGIKKDAFVCKGTTQGGAEHCWVMTREQGGAVTFWETTTAARYHLPKRWSGKHHGSGDSKMAVQARWKGRKLIPNWKEVGQARKGFLRKDHMEHLKELMGLPISPWEALYQDQLIAVIPYESIEVVFNNSNTWGNMTNHHPSCIYYDMEDDPQSWNGLMGEQSKPILHRHRQDQGIAIPVGPPVSKHTAQELQDAIMSELKESCRMTRIRSGFETFFEDSDVLKEVLEQWLDLLELECQLDADWAVDAKGKPQKPSGHPSPFNSQDYVASARKKWAAYWQQRAKLMRNRVNLPVKENHQLSCVPMHCSTSDIKEVRHYIIDAPAVQEYLKIASDNVVFLVVCKVFPMANSVASVWVWLGVQVPLSKEQIWAIAEEELNQTHDPEAELKLAMRAAEMFEESPDKGKGKGRGRGDDGY